MLAVALTWALFLGWTAVGLAVLSAGRFRCPLRQLLLAPAVGCATIAVVAYIVLQFGVPAGRSAVPIGLGVSAVTAALLLRAWPGRLRVAAGWRRSRLFAGILVAAFGLTAWPMLDRGFDWVANGNDDMANYCLAASGFRDHGYLRVPTAEELHSRQDQTQSLWFLYNDPVTFSQTRRGSELTLALASVWTGLTPQQVFMPTIVALNLAMIGAAAALVLIGTRRRAAAAWAAALLAVSSQTGYGVVQQLIAQVGGLGLLCASLALVTSPFRRLPAALLLRRAAVCGVVFAGFVVFYPEAVPFLVGGCVVLGVRDLLRRRPVGRHLAHAAAAIACMAALVPVYLYGTVHFLLGQAAEGTSDKTHKIEIFPYFMTPRGPALVWGLIPSYGEVAEPRLSGSIALGLALLAAVVVIAAVQLRRGRAFAAVVLVMAALGTGLYLQRSAFGLFKIAMFAQPFLWASLAAWALSRRGRWRTAGAVGLLLLGGLNAGTQFWFVRQSTGHDHQVDLPAVSGQRLMTEYRRSMGPAIAAGRVSRVVIATDNNVLAKLLSAEVGNFPNSHIAMAPLDRTINVPVPGTHADEPGERERAVYELSRRWIHPSDRDQPFVIDPDTGRPLRRLMHTPADWTADPQDRVYLAAGIGQLSVFNRYRHPESGPALLCAPMSEVRNFAVFRDAAGARQHFLGMDDPRDIGLYRSEPDPCFRGDTMAGVGRYLVLDVLNASPRVRVVVNCTVSFRPDPERRGLPPVHVVGASRVPLGAVGDGSARLATPPLAPQAIGPSRILALDFGVEPTRNPNRLVGAERLWGTDLPRDRRLLTAAVRDISVVSEEEYAAFHPPEKISELPRDLRHPHLEYSGLYEEGWMRKEFKVRLTQPGAGQDAVVRGMIPQLRSGDDSFRTELTVLIDGTPAERRTLKTGDFEVRVPVPDGTAPRWIECRFTNEQKLPAPDGRLAVAHLRFVGFEPRDEAQSRPPVALAAFPADLQHPRLERSGLHDDGWMAQEFAAKLWQPGPGEAVVRGQVPVVPGVPDFRTELTVLLDGVEKERRTLGPGDFEVRVPAATAAGARRIECRFTRTQRLPDPDGRAVGAHLRFVGFETGTTGH